MFNDQDKIVYFYSTVRTTGIGTCSDNTVNARTHERTHS